MNHTQTANASHCSCGMLWIDHCEGLVIRVEKLSEILKALLTTQTCRSVDKTCEGLDSPCDVCRAREILRRPLA